MITTGVPKPMQRALSAISVLVLLITTAATTTRHIQAQGGTQFFPETGKTVSGRFLDYWKTHGGLAQQGYPISETMGEVSDTDGKLYIVQYFERAVFETHPENPPPNDVLLSLLGVFLYKQKYPAGAPGQQPSIAGNSRIFPETGKRVGGLFLNYWSTHGGLAQQGFPISDEFNEVSDLNGQTYRVQYFERAVFELHPENPPPYDVLLSQLGRFRYLAKTAPKPTPIPPTPVPPTAVPPNPTPTSVADDLERGKVRVFGPVSGLLIHDESLDFIKVRRAGVSLKNFVAESKFYNPYDRARRSWDYGILFRRPANPQGGYSQYRLSLISDGTWSLTLGLGDGPYGDVPDMDLSATGSNVLKVIARDANSWVFVNGKLITTQALTDNQNAGDIAVGTGMYAGDEITGEVTRYENFTVWSLP